MKAFHTILFGADFSEGSRDAFRAACSLAVPGQTTIHVVHVIEPHWVPEEPVPYGQVVVEFYDAKGDGCRDEIICRRLREEYAPEIPVEVEYHIREGEPAAQLLRMAERLNPDLLVVGTHGRTGLSWLLAGSVATTIVRRARCPVLAYHRPEVPRKLEEIRTILHPTDFSPGSEHSLGVARSMARDLGARLVLMHVIPYGVYASDMTVAVDPAVYREALEQERRMIEGPDLKYPVATRLAQGDASEEILQAAVEIDGGLIVMGTHGRTGLSRLLMGSVTERVVTRSACPVLAIKAGSTVTRHRSSEATEPVAAGH